MINIEKNVLPQGIVRLFNEFSPSTLVAQCKLDVVKPDRKLTI